MTKSMTENVRNLFVSTDKEAQDDVVIELENIQKTYLLGVEGVPALRGVSVKIHRGEFIAIYGTSGGGKTSMLNIIGTIDKPTKGYLTICGQRIGSRTTDTDLANIRLRKMGFVFQTFNLLSTMTAIENVEMPMILHGTFTKSERRNRAKELLEKVGLSHRMTHIPSQLSGGEQQRCTIARAISNRPEILLLDEPTGDLDTKNTLIVMQMLMELNEKDGITMVMVTHDQNLKNAADRVIYMRDGKIDRIERSDRAAKEAYKASIRHELENVGSGSSSSSAGKNTKKGRFTSTTQIKRPCAYETYHQSAEVVAESLLDEFEARKLKVSSAAAVPSIKEVEVNVSLPPMDIIMKKKEEEESKLALMQKSKRHSRHGSDSDSDSLMIGGASPSSERDVVVLDATSPTNSDLVLDISSNLSLMT